MSGGNWTDEAAMAALADGNADGLDVLMERYQQDIFRFCLHYLKDVERARDLTQDTFLRVYKARGRFDDSRSFRPWILCIARNLCLNEIKRKKTVVMESLEHVSAQGTNEFQDATETPDGAAESSERLALLDKALDALPAESREIVVLRYFQRMSARDIAEIVGSTEGAVRTRLHRILAGLRKEYETEAQEFL